MSLIVTYRIARAEDGGYNVSSIDKEKVDASGWSTTEEGAILAFKDAVSKAMPDENTFIFVTEKQSEAMEGYTEMEKHGQKGDPPNVMTCQSCSYSWDHHGFTIGPLCPSCGASNG